MSYAGCPDYATARTRDLHRHVETQLQRAVDCPTHHKLVTGRPVNHGDAFLAIPAIGYVRHADTITGRGRWDARNLIFRCVVQCPDCGKDACDRRVWYLLDNHPSHRCDACKREAQRRSISNRARANLGAYMPHPASFPPATEASASSAPVPAIEDPQDRPAISDNLAHDLREIEDFNTQGEGGGETLYYTPEAHQ